MAVGSGIAGIEQISMARRLISPHFRTRPIQSFRLRSLFKGGRQPFMDKGIDGFVFLAQDLGMVGIGGDSFDAEGEGAAGKEYPYPCGSDLKPDLLTLSDQSFQVSFRG